MGVPYNARRVLLAVCAGLLLPSIADAQTGEVRGRITSAGGAPVPGASIRVGSGSEQAVAGSNGDYSLRAMPVGEHTLLVERIGYEPARRAVNIAADSVVNIDIVLDAAPVTLDGIVASVLTATRTETSVGRVGNAVSVVTAREIEDRQLASLDDALRPVPGVVMSRTGSAGNPTYIRMRGFTNKHVLVMLDGVRMTDPTASSNEFHVDHVLLDDVERVEVLRGPQSGIYGSDAMAGVVNIITRRDRGAPGGSAYVEAGARGMARGGASAGGEIGRASLDMNAAYHRTDGYSVASRAPGNVEDDGYRNWTLSGSARVRLLEESGVVDDLDLTVRGRRSDATTDTDANFGDAPEFFYQDSEHQAFSKETMLQGDVRSHLLGGLLDGRVTVAGFIADARTELGDSTTSDTRGTTTNVNAMLTVHVPVPGSLLGDVTASFGFERFDEEAEIAGTTVLTQEDLGSTGVYASLTVPMLERLHVSAAGRLEDNDRFGGVETFRLAGAWEVPMPGAFRVTKLRASLGTGFESPSLQQLFGESPSTQPNPDLVAEESSMWDVGVHFVVGSGQLIGEIGYYSGWADNGIFSVFDEHTGKYMSQNIPSRVELRGVETSLTARPTDAVSLQLAHTWAEATIIDTGVQLFERPKHLASLYGSVDVTPRWTVGATVTLRDNQLASFPSDYWMDGYTRIDVRTAFRLSDGVELFGRVENIADTEYEDRLGTSTPRRGLFVGARTRF